MSIVTSSTKIQRRQLQKVIKKVSRKIDDREQGFVSPYEDLSRYNYTRTWNDELFVTVYGYDVNIPDMPNEKDIINYGKPIEEQIFRKTLIPDDLQYWPEEQKEAFIQREHHRRRHGLWFYIKGEPVYITGQFYYFLNYWSVQTGKPVMFHMGDWKFFIIWMHVVMTDTIFGLLVFKCRRVGDTEKGLCIVYEYATRVKNTINQLYDCRTEKDMIKTFKRLKLAHRKMIWYMKPITKNNDPSTSFEFTEKEKRVELSKSYIDDNGNYNNSDYEYPGLESEITYYTNDGGADGSRIGREYVDEFGKFNQINPVELWDLSKKALEDDREGYIIGKSLFTSTIEELSNGKTLEVAQQMWDDSDPDKLDPEGRTVSGMIRIVRGALDRAVPDRWGFVDEEKETEKIKSHLAFLIKNKQWVKLIKYKRQNCLTIKDVFSNISKGSPFNLENANNRLNELTYDLDPLFVQGDLDWVDGKAPIPGDPHKTNRDCKVFFTPNDKGLYYISAHPNDFPGIEANRMKPNALIPMPGNTLKFSCGIDPISYKDNIIDQETRDGQESVRKKRSLAGLAIKRNLDKNIDNNSDCFDERGNVIDGGRFLKTNRYCCVYLGRHDSPNKNYEDWLKAIVYYGTDFLIEKNHSSGFYTYLEIMEFTEYYMEKSGVSNYRGKQETFGMTASEKTVEGYFSHLGDLLSEYWNTIDIPLILEQLCMVEYETRTKFDLAVACGFCETASRTKIPNIVNAQSFEESQGLEYTEIQYDFD